MTYIGIDLHRDYFVAHAEDEGGEKLLSGRYDNHTDSIGSLLSGVSNPVRVAVEATRNWMWFVRALQERGCGVIMAHPFRTKAIAAARIKTDSIDAATLCQLLRAGLVPASYIATPSEVDDREISRARIALVKQRTKLKNMVLAILAKENLRFKGTDTFGKSGRDWLSGQSLSAAKEMVINTYLTLVDQVDGQVKELDALIKQKSSGCPRALLLNTIPGIGSTTAFLLASEIGDIKRFKSAKSFASYFGLVPRLNQSGNHTYYGRITKTGNPYVRWALVQTVHRITRMSPYWGRWRDRLAYRVGKKKATVAVARRLSCIIFAMLRDNKPYNPNHAVQRFKLGILPESK